MIEPTDLSAVPEVSVASVFEEFFLAHHEQLFQALYLLTGDRSEADDLAQEALLRAYERWDRVGAMESPAGYVYRTALNLHRSQLRRLIVRARRVFASIPALAIAFASKLRVTGAETEHMPCYLRAFFEYFPVGCTGGVHWRTRSYSVNLLARMSTRSMVGGSLRSSSAFCISAVAVGPARCASRPFPSGKTSKIPKVDGPRRIANHAEVASSCSASGSAPSRKLATSCSFPGLASSRARTPTVTTAAPFCRLNSHGTAELRFKQERA